MDIKKIAYFLEIVKYQSIGKTARKIGVNQSILSKALKNLEEELGCQLYIHYDKTFRLTQTGEMISKYFQRLIAVYDSLKSELRSFQENPKGKLTLTCSSGFLHFFFPKVMADFLEQNKDISLRIRTNDIKLTLDIGIDACIGPKIEEVGVTSICLHSYQLKIYASQKYLDTNGYPEKPEDLDHHQLIAYSQDIQSTMMDFDWHLRYGAPNGVSRTPYLEITSSYALKKAAEMNLGIITFSQHIIDREKSNLINIFPNEGININIYFSYRTEQEVFWPLILLRDFLLEYKNELESIRD